MLIDVGQVIAKKYELVRLLGRGSMGEVWSAHHTALNESVALKVLTWPPSGEDKEEPAVALGRFRFEAQVAARLSRKTRHIARVTDYGEDDGLPYLVMELLDGEALDAALRVRGPLPPAEAAQIVSQIARALEQAHAESVAHRDLKPANVFLTHDEEGRLLVKLLDFGIARTIRLQASFSTGKGFVFGTPGYMSPEQTRASPKLNHRCDLWALATLAYQMVSDHLPVDGGDIDELMKNVCAGRIIPLRQRKPALSDALGAFFDRAFADCLDDRFQTASALALAFELACQSAPGMVPLSSPSLTDTGTGTEFSATVAREALRVHRSTRTKLTWAVAGVLVTASIGLGSLWRTLAAPRSQAGFGPNGAPSFESVAKAVQPIPSAPAESASASVWSPAPPAASATLHRSAVSPVRSSRPLQTAPPLQAVPPRVKVAPHAHPRPSDDRNDVF